MSMRNFDNSLRLYNHKVLKKTKMHVYTKRYIDNLMKRSILCRCKVPLMKLTTDDIENFKLSLIKNMDNIPKKEGIDDTSMDNEPDKKKQKLDKNEKDILELEKSKKCETHTLILQFNSSLKPIKEIASIRTEEIPIDCDESTKSAKDPGKNVTPTIKIIDPRKIMDDIKSENSSAKIAKPTINITDPRKMMDDTKSTNSSAKIVKPTIKIIDPKKMMDKSRYIKWMKTLYLDKKPKNILNGKFNLTSAKPSTSKPNPVLHSTNVNEVEYHLDAQNSVIVNLTEIEKLYNKYFGKSVQDTIMIIANILNIMAISNKHHKEQMDEYFKKKPEAEKLKERCNATTLHGIHKTILETKLKTNFVNVISSFAESEFVIVFQMFFLSIIIVLRVLDQPKYSKCRIFKNLVLLLSTSLKNREFNHPKVFSILQSKTFRYDCVKLISIIEDSRDTDPEVIYRMPLFFISNVDVLGYFQAATDAVTGKTNNNLELLIDNASYQCSIYSKFKDPVDSSTVEHSNRKLPSTETIQSPINSDDIIQHTLLTKNPNGTIQLIPVPIDKTQTISNTDVEPSLVTIQPLNNFNEQISSTLQKNTYESASTSKVIPTKKVIAVTPTISNSPLNLHQTGSSSKTATSTSTDKILVTLNPLIQNIRTEPYSTSNITQGSTILPDKKPFKTVHAKSGEMRVESVGANLQEKPPIAIKCFMDNCNKLATIMCGKCVNVHYCSKTCQRRHWYANHMNECENCLSNSQPLP